MADLPKPGAAVKRDRVLSESELKTVWAAAEKTAWPFGPAIRLLVLTASRRDEIGSLRWSEVHGNEIRIPAERSKSGEPRIIPLSAAAMKLIGELPRVGDHVFSKNGSGLGGWAKAKRSIDATAAEMNSGPLTAWRLHDVRRTTATGLQRLGVGLQTIESILGHISGSRSGIVAVYQRYAFEAEKRTALEAWAVEIERIASGKKPGKLVFVTAALNLSSSLTADVKPIDMRWVEAVRRADKTKDFEPLVAYLRQPGTQWGPAEFWWLQLLFERLQYKRKKPGPLPPIGQTSKKDKYASAAAYVSKLQDEGRSHDEAIDEAAKTFPDIGEDGRVRLADYIKRGHRLK